MTKFDGTPSFELKHRPFFSIVVACYNSRRTIGRLLESIAEQNLKDEIEVILSDDCSTESYDDIVDQYSNRICIKRVQTDYNCCPGNTRERGIEYVTGEWLMIADHDDKLVPNSLKTIMEVQKEYNEKFLMVSCFHELFDAPGNFENRWIRDVTTNTGWNHGKFFNMDNLWKKFNIHFIKDMKTHEDIFITTTINCIMHHIDRQPLLVKTFTYIWHKRPGSISNIVYSYNNEPHPFLEVHFLDYVRSTSGCYKENYLLNNISKAFMGLNLVETLLYQYFYMQGFIFHSGDKVIKENFDICKRELLELKKLTGLTNIEIYALVSENDAERYMNVYESAKIGSGPFIPEYTFKQWLEMLSQ